MSSEETLAERDDALMARLCARERDAFAKIIALHARSVHRLAWRMLGDAAEAEDVTQEALLKLWHNADRWIPGRNGIAPWLTRIATNICIDRLRRIRPVTGSALPERIDESAGADTLIDEDRVRALIHAALLALPDRQRAAIVLTYFEDYPNRLAAETLDMNIKAFESILLRGRKALREELAARGLVGWEAAE